MAKSSRSNSLALNRRELLRLSTAVGVGAVMPTYGAFADTTRGPSVAAGTCSTPRSAVATTQYGKVRGYVEDDVFTFKGVPYGASTGGENRWLPAKPPTAWDGEYPALIWLQPKLPGTFTSVGEVAAKSPTCPKSFAPQQYASRDTVIAQVWRAPALIDVNLTPA